MERLRRTAGDVGGVSGCCRGAGLVGFFSDPVEARFFFSEPETREGIISRECEVIHISLPIPPPNVRGIDPGQRGEDMAQEPDSLAFRFAVVLALALIVLTATMWAAPPNATNDTAVPIPTEAIYRAQHLNLF